MKTIKTATHREAVNAILEMCGHEFSGILAAQIECIGITLEEDDDRLATIYTQCYLPGVEFEVDYVEGYGFSYT